MAKRKGQGSDPDIDQRVRKIYLLMLNAPSNSHGIFHLISELAKREEWNVSERQVYNYIKKAKEILALYQPQEVKFYKKLHLARLEDIYSKQIIAKDFRGAVRTLDRIANLLGLNAPVEVAHTMDTRSIPDLQKELDDLVKRRRSIEKLTYSQN